MTQYINCVACKNEALKLSEDSSANNMELGSVSFDGKDAHLQFWCELCHKFTHLSFIHHKGTTQLETTID